MLHKLIPLIKTMELDNIKTEICDKFCEAIHFRKPTIDDVNQIDHFINGYLQEDKHNPDRLWWIINHIKHRNEYYDSLAEKAGNMMIEIAPSDQLTRPIVDNFLYSLALVGLRLDIIVELIN